jgi:hypothetical protein
MFAGSTPKAAGLTSRWRNTALCFLDEGQARTSGAPPVTLTSDMARQFRKRARESESGLKPEQAAAQAAPLSVVMAAPSKKHEELLGPAKLAHGRSRGSGG